MSLFLNMELVKRSYPGAYEKGQWKKGAPVNTGFMGTAQPASGKVLELLPSGKRNIETITVFAPIEMKFIVADEDAKVSGDIIVYKGCHYEVVMAREWDVGLLPHWELAASKVGQDGD